MSMQADRDRSRNVEETWAEQCQHWQDVARGAEAKVAHLEAAWRRADEDANAALAKVARVERLMAHLQTDLVHMSDLRAALDGQS